MSTPADYAARTAALLKFVHLRLHAAELMAEAAKLPGIPALYRQQALSAAYLCGTNMHTVRGQASELDATQLARELLDLSRRCVDPLVAAIGDEAAENFHNVDPALFKDQLLGAVEGNATEVIEAAGRDLTESWLETVAEKRREFQRAE